MGDEERFKGAVHAAAAVLFGVMASYNAMRVASGTGARRNVVNLALYVPLVAWEWAQVYHHWSGREKRRGGVESEALQRVP